ncbi:hypothetical protein G6F37_005265 [Rhizopus arrhizus]|nr:hypothetical protein G6F38_005404 [Rhizopus arrhizus]KAG1159032.1 hypothetical protein G6F37_005265 [Rhizopus arrhizus]
MPPKKARKPLNPLQRKQLKRKKELIHKATVKSQYYKALKKDDDDTPDYVKEIFGAQERTIDKNGNVVELEKTVDDEEFDMESEEEESEEEDTSKNKRQRMIDAAAKQHKPNPFKAEIEERERRKKESEEEKKARAEQYKKQKEERHTYYKDRSDKRRKMLAKTKSGQPKMAARMDVLLEKIQKEA